MPRHAARFPGTSNDPRTHRLTDRQSVRLAAIADVPANEVAGRVVAELPDHLRHRVGPPMLAFRRLCGQVVKADSDGQEHPVPFATVTVYDVDLRLVAWSPPWTPFSWFFPFVWKREELATVTTDECGRFCVWIPRFDIDFFLRWRLERRCYLEWLRKPNIEELLRIPEPGPIPPIATPLPIPRPFERLRPIERLRPVEELRPVERSRDLDARHLRHADRVLDRDTVERLRNVIEDVRPGALAGEIEAELGRTAFTEALAPPLDDKARAMLGQDNRATLAGRVGVPERMLAGLDPHRAFGPFIRCHWVAIPEWSAVLDVPDLTFEVTQDIDGDGNQEIIYSEGLFDVRWDSTLTDVKLYANQNAIAGPSCDLPDPGPCGDPAILFAGNYPLQVPGNASDYHDAGSGYAKLPNRPDADGVPGGARTSPAQTPFTGRFFLVGCAERPGATHYRVHHEVGGSAGYLTGSYGPLTKVVGGTLMQKIVSPEGGHWYPIVPRSDGWTPVGILAPVHVHGLAKHTFRLEFGQQAGTTINPVAGSLTDPVGVQVDTQAPVVSSITLAWRQPDVSMTWQPLDPFDCAVMQRSNASRVQLRLGMTVTANHMRHFRVSPHGCGPIAAPSLITDGRDGLPLAPADAAAHWHTHAGDNAAVRTLYYELPASAPAGCYSFSIYATSRAFDPNAAVTGVDPVVAWQGHDPVELWVKPVVNVALQ